MVNKRFVINHWDTFDNEDFTVGSTDTLDEAIAFVDKEYGKPIHSSGADKVQIYDSEKKQFVWSRDVR